jgi:hypothetical protein
LETENKEKPLDASKVPMCDLPWKGSNDLAAAEITAWKQFYQHFTDVTAMPVTNTLLVSYYGS